MEHETESLNVKFQNLVQLPSSNVALKAICRLSNTIPVCIMYDYVMYEYINILSENHLERPAT